MLGSSMKKYFWAFAILGALCATVQAAEVKVNSPDGKAVITVTDAGGLSYAVTFDGREVVAKSRFGIIADDVDLGADAKLGKTSSRKIRESYSMFGGHSEANNNCRETTVAVRTAAGENYELDVRAYNDGVAFRYFIPASTPVEEILIRNEATEFNFANPSALMHLPAQPDYDLPFVVEQPGIGWIAIAEAGTESKSVQYPRTYLARTDSGMITTLARSTKEPSIAYAGPTPLVWPWRAVLVGSGREGLMQSNTLRNLDKRP